MVKGLLQINNDYAIRKTSIYIDTPAIVSFQCWPLLIIHFHSDSVMFGYSLSFRKFGLR